jgi:hypothetical protein
MTFRKGVGEPRSDSVRRWTIAWLLKITQDY